MTIECGLVANKVLAHYGIICPELLLIFVLREEMGFLARLPFGLLSAWELLLAIIIIIIVLEAELWGLICSGAGGATAPLLVIWSVRWTRYLFLNR